MRENAGADPEPDRPIGDWDELCEPFRSAEKPEREWRIGAETEKFGILLERCEPLPYAGDRSLSAIFGRLCASGWLPVRETDAGPVIAVKRGEQSLTLEPGAQFELSGAPLPDVHALVAEHAAHFRELRPVSDELGVAWLSVGFHPLAALSSLPWVPKQRYGVMRRYLPPRGNGALDMMQRTATAQANFDFSDEQDAMRKLRIALKWSPIIHAMTANAPFHEASLAGMKSVRGDVWLRMDPQRSGLIPSLWKDSARYRDYVEWALDAGMFLFKREGNVIDNSGQTFRSFLSDGFRGHRATRNDWLVHLNTLFPEVRLKSTLELRCADAQSPSLAAALFASFTGILYDRRALDAAESLAERFTYTELEALRPELVRHGLTGTLAGRPVRDLATELCDIAAAGLRRRARLDADGRDESTHLSPLRTLVGDGRVPADLLLEGLGGERLEPRALVERCRIPVSPMP